MGFKGRELHLHLERGLVPCLHVFCDKGGVEVWSLVRGLVWKSRCNAVTNARPVMLTGLITVLIGLSGSHTKPSLSFTLDVGGGRQRQ